MRSYVLIHSRIPALLLTTLLASAGCGSIDPLALKTREADEFRFENERRREALIENLEESSHQRQTATELSEEKKSLLAKTQELAAGLKTSTEQLALASTQRDEARAKLADVEQSNERLRESIEKVKSVASSSAGELAELRLRRRELEEQGTKLTQSESGLREENARLSKELAEARAELVRARAVARSFQESGSGSGQVPVGSDSERNLERELAGLRGENLALLRRIEALNQAAGAASPGGTQPGTTTATAPAGGLYREDPAGLFGEICGFVKRRYDVAVQGKIAWDTFDIAAVGVASLAVLFFIWSVIRRARIRRLLDEAVRGAAKARESGRAAQAAAASQASESHAEAGRSRRASSNVRRSSSFPAVISAKHIPAEEPAAEAHEVEEAPAHRPEPVAPPKSRRIVKPAAPQPAASADDDPFHRILSESAAKAAPAPAREKERPAAEPRKVIGARSWEAEAHADSAEPEDDLASTQIIPSLEEEESVVAHVHAGPPKAAPTKKATPIVPPAKQAPKAAPAAASESSDDRELLAELKSVINRKFDELMK